MPPRKQQVVAFDPKDYDMDVVQEGTSIVLPKGMSLDKAIETLTKKQTDLKTQVDVYEEVDALPFDGAVAFMWAMKEMFGWTEAVPTPPKSFFEKERQPTFVNVRTGPGPDDSQKVIWGSFNLPNFVGRLETSAIRTKAGWRFCIRGLTIKRDMPLVAELARRTRGRILSHSIYRGKALDLAVNEDGELDVIDSDSIGFMDLSKVDPDDLILSGETATLLQATLFNPILHTERCRQLKIPLTRGLLLFGDYGMGKTLCGRTTAKLCVENGWTFISLRNVRGIADCITYAKRFSPCVVYAEDLDQVLGSNERDDVVNDILNTIDGPTSRSAEIITILTTNDVFSINKAMLRAGRLDCLVEFLPPDAKATERLIRLYAREHLPRDASLSRSIERLTRQRPATICEAVHRATLLTVGQEMDTSIELTDEMICLSASTLTRHLEIEAHRPAKARPVEQALSAVFQVGMNGSSDDGVDMTALSKQVRRLHDRFCS